MKILVPLLAILVLCSSHSVDRETSGQITEALQAVNRMRLAAGLDSVRISDKLSAACYNHAKYLFLNRGSDKVEGLNAHKEFPELPGYTVSGSEAGAKSVIHYLNPVASVIGWEATFYHRVPLLQPNLKEIGIGYYEGEGYESVCLIDCISGLKGDAGTDVVYYPGNNQQNVPLRMGPEFPHPMKAKGTYGFPLTIYFAQWQSVKSVKFELYTDSGEQVACSVSTPEKPATDFPQWNTICAIPLSPLLPDTEYEMKVKARVDDSDFERAIRFRTAAGKN